MVLSERPSNFGDVIRKLRIAGGGWERKKSPPKKWFFEMVINLPRGFNPDKNLPPLNKQKIQTIPGLLNSSAFTGPFFDFQ